MELELYQIDAFATRPFSGNPAAVCPLAHWLPDPVMQAIAMENNLSETAFFVRAGSDFHIRWFTPAAEVDLCGHATLAAACVLYEQLGYSAEQLVFQSRSGPLGVKREGHLYTLDFPVQKPTACPFPAVVLQAFNQVPTQCLKAEDYIVVFEDEESIANIRPNPEQLKRLDLRGVIVTAPASGYDYAVRFFAPKYGIAEDPVTGSAYTQLAPYWSERLNKTEHQAKQLSARGGDVCCRLAGERVLISGAAVLVLKGTLILPDC